MFTTTTSNTLRSDLKALTLVENNSNNIPQFLSENREEEILTELGFKEIVDKSRRNRTQNEYLKKYGSLIKTKDILKIAKDYGLLFMKSKYYIGELGEKTLDLSAKFLNENKGKNKQFFILAPPEKFNLKEIDQEIQEKLDPTLFVYIDQDLWLMIDSWGADFKAIRKYTISILRTIWNIINYTPISILVLISSFFAVAGIGWLLINFYYYGFNFSSIHLDPIISYLLMPSIPLSSFVWGFVIYMESCNGAFPKYQKYENEMLKKLKDNQKLDGIKIL